MKSQSEKAVAGQQEESTGTQSSSSSISSASVSSRTNQIDQEEPQRHSLASLCWFCPHGVASLIPAVLATLGWLAGLFQDGCDYAKLVSPADRSNSTSTAVTAASILLDQLSLASDTPWLEVGRKAYREPIYNENTGAWETNLQGTCLAYPTSVIESSMDVYWTLAKVFAFAAQVLGGTVTFYLWATAACCVFSKGSWKLMGAMALMAAIFQMLSFVWFATDLCQEHGHADSETTRDGRSTLLCHLYFGSQADIVATILWLLASLYIFSTYPLPRTQKVQVVVIEEDVDEEDENDKNRAKGKRFRGNGKVKFTKVDQSEIPAKNLPQSANEDDRLSGASIV